jgi:hypothetical protein
LIYINQLLTHTLPHYLKPNTSKRIRTLQIIAMSSLNYPLLAIPAYYVFSILPHAYASGVLSSAGYKVNNANPKASLSPSAVKGKVPDAV